MKWVLKILHRHLANEKNWLRMERYAADRQTQEGVRMAKERVPQLETAIELLTNNFFHQGDNGAGNKQRGDAQPLPTYENQLNLFT